MGASCRQRPNRHRPIIPCALHHLRAAAPTARLRSVRARRTDRPAGSRRRAGVARKPDGPEGAPLRRRLRRREAITGGSNESARAGPGHAGGRVTCFLHHPLRLAADRGPDLRVWIVLPRAASRRSMKRTSPSGRPVRSPARRASGIAAGGSSARKARQSGARSRSGRRSQRWSGRSSRWLRALDRSHPSDRLQGPGRERLTRERVRDRRYRWRNARAGGPER